MTIDEAIEALTLAIEKHNVYPMTQEQEHLTFVDGLLHARGIISKIN